jgi:uncharacterized protein YjbI with pentapeptide repeats
MGNVDYEHKPKHCIDLRATRLEGYSDAFEDGTYKYINFSNSTLANNRFVRTKFIDCHFGKSNITKTRHFSSQFINCNFFETDFRDADLALSPGINKSVLNSIRFNKETKFQNDLKKIAEEMIARNKNRGLGP